ncbi:unnamed protein product [Parascedosporium putredinis]|uniref:MFS transporter n=1 Tax=Parascedosporium putredinis TaxID=1442378 RepID=A0A9P1HBY5_9PEZI|nr:unnamed protein product [Parascedosporium putredinis]CAI8004187.1 unnamed protein product [Parascedosporium putredinis]
MADTKNEKPTIETLEEGGSGSIRTCEAGTPGSQRSPKPPRWRKNAIVLIVGLYSAIAVLATSGMGAIVTQVTAMYPPEDAVRVNDLLTYPTLFMGIGNLFAMPLCVALGRRPVFLISLVIMVASGIWCACSQSLSSHIAGRDVLSMAAGQSEALVAYMVQEVHFLHQRGTAATWNAAIQGIGTGGMFVATTYLVSAWGFAGEEPGTTSGSKDEKTVPVVTKSTHTLDLTRYAPRTWKDDLRVFHFRPRWGKTLTFYKVTAQSFCIPSIVWLLLLNGAFLGVYVFHSSTFAPLLMSPPYSFKFEFLGFVQLALIIANLVALPVLGYGSDWVIRVMSRRNRGIYKPEYRLVGAILPAIVAVVSCVIYGRTASNRETWSWAGIAIPMPRACFPSSAPTPSASPTSSIAGPRRRDLYFSSSRPVAASSASV